MAERARYFEELEVGQEFRSVTRTIAESDLYIFAGLTGDMTDFHLSTEAATASLFSGRPAHGMLLLGIANGLYNRIGVTDGTGLALMGVEWRFLAPAFIGDTIHLIARVEKKRDIGTPDRGLVFWTARLLNQKGAVLCKGQLIKMVKRNPTAAPSSRQS